MTTGDTLDALLEAIPMPAILVGQGERILGANAEARAIFGEGIRGRNLVMVMRHPPLIDAIDAAQRDGRRHKTRFLTTREGQDITYEATCSAVDTGSGRAVVACIQDTTDVEKADQMRRDFVANVSHELRTPLTALLGFIETLRGPARNDGKAQERFLGIMANEAGRMERLVRDLLSLSRVESEERMRPSEQLDLVQLLRSVKVALAPVAEKGNVAITLDLPQEEAAVPGDADQLRQVFTNLTENAIKYGGAGKEVTLRLELRDQMRGLRGPVAVVTVEDRGPGIAAVHLPRLTERFYRVDSHRSREMGGTGLGLAIVKHIVNRHRGRMSIESTEGEGTTVTVALPMR